MSTLSTPEFLLTPGLLIIYDHAGVTILVSNSCHVGGIHRNPIGIPHPSWLINILVNQGY